MLRLHLSLSLDYSMDQIDKISTWMRSAADQIDGPKNKGKSKVNDFLDKVSGGANDFLKKATDGLGVKVSVSTPVLILLAVGVLFLIKNAFPKRKKRK